MKLDLEKFRSVMTAGFKKFEDFAGKVYDRINDMLNRLYGDSKRSKSVFAAVFSVVLVLLVTIFSTTISNFSVQVDPNYGQADTLSSVEQAYVESVEDFPVISEDIAESEPESEIESGIESETESSEETSSVQQTTTTAKPENLKKISAVKSTYNINTGKSVKVGVVYQPDNAINKSIKWSSSNTDVATVDGSGTVKGVSEGSCKITGVAASDSALALSVTVNVTKPSENKSGNKYFIKVYVGSQSVVVYSKDSKGDYTVPVRTMACSTGTSGNDTPLTSFKILRKYRWKELMGPTWEQYCCSLSNSYLFHSIPYNRKNDPSSISKGAYNALGRRASHGCVRLACIDAKWIYDNCPIGTGVQVVSGSGPRGSKVPMNNDSYYAGWDPTDPDPNSPYNKRPPSKTTTTKKTTTTTVKKTTTTTKKTTTTIKPTTSKPTTPKPTTPKPTTPKPTTPKPTTPKPTTPKPTTSKPTTTTTKTNPTTTVPAESETQNNE